MYNYILKGLNDEDFLAANALADVQIQQLGRFLQGQPTTPATQVLVNQQQFPVEQPRGLPAID